MTTNKTHNTPLVKNMFLLVAGLLLLLPAMAFANSQRDVTTVANNIVNTFFSVETLLISIAYIVGIAFALSAIIKFKNHKENPQQVPLSNPVIELCVALALIFLPTMIEIFEATMLNETVSNSVAPIRGGNVNVNSTSNSYSNSNITSSDNNELAIQIPDNCLQYPSDDGELLVYCMAENGKLIPMPAEMLISSNSSDSSNSESQVATTQSSNNQVNPDVIQKLQDRFKDDEVALSMLRALQNQN